MTGPLDPELLVGAGLFLGGAVAGIISSAKLPFRNKPTSSCIEKSYKTSGALHISEEGLQKIVNIETSLKHEYLTADKHRDFCAIQQGAIKLYISDVLKAHTKEILRAIKDTGGNEHPLPKVGG